MGARGDEHRNNVRGPYMPSNRQGRENARNPAFSREEDRRCYLKLSVVSPVPWTVLRPGASSLLPGLVGPFLVRSLEADGPDEHLFITEDEIRVGARNTVPAKCRKTFGDAGWRGR